ncbi:GGDEF domain-containing protein [Actinoplanes sp. NPDC051633]|uniref:GGDEF domain-containing protein n=1 Tax=Actinoplanes sp. NPDC051633 TaxID=3155670 RepID=UPI003415B003
MTTVPTTATITTATITTTAIITAAVLIVLFTAAALGGAAFWRRATRRCVAALRQADAAARRDPLTGLSNRTAFQHAITGRPAALILLNLDGSATCRRLIGDRMFDELLVILAGRLTQHTDAAGDRVFRLRRDEFAVLTDHAPGPLADRLLAAIAEPAELGSSFAVTVEVTACAGVVHQPNTRTALRHADTALRTAKNGGRGRTVVFTPGVHQPGTR